MKEIFPKLYYKSKELFFEDVPLKDVAEREGTPTYVYSKGALQYWFEEFDSAFNEVSHTTCFAVKSNSNIQVLKVLRELGAGADTVSVGEIFRALTAGIDPKKIVFAGVGKREDELTYALERGILMVNVESEGELLLLNKVGEKLKRRAPFAIRVNPDVNPKTHPYISTGLKSAKFGVTFDRALELYKKAKELRWLNPVGVHFHIGSQITDVSAFREAAEKVAEFVKEIRSFGIEIEYFDAGGGLGINYHPDERVVPAKELAEEIVPIVKELDCHLILEPGRRIAGNAGVLLTRVLYVKKREEKTFYIVDAGMNDLSRLALYNAYHHILPLEEKKEETVVADVVGPICETGDILAKERELPVLKEGDLLAILSAGAYGFTMASNYNSRPRPPEVLIDGDKFRVIREREKLGDLISREEVL
ncbi:diaminopimelate decarboxylase [Balnearium lithotrophicum]|uniref:Diaminopimelate decarboxylase n=1 Tax=Balnearium lithotrophicum TaxID=223788 RepID=A0A521BBK3_9BACT|nr:diaminopimelate decarboxylase [Balnearium lithotrophicum]SMO44467.1 diaminopimelate decarboxylase [Balnearium lithotrophicum]